MSVGSEPPRGAGRGEGTVRILEVTLAAESAVDAADERKQQKYSGLEEELKRLGWKVEKTAVLVIGARGPEWCTSEVLGRCETWA